MKTRLTESNDIERQSRHPSGDLDHTRSRIVFLLSVRLGRIGILVSSLVGGPIGDYRHPLVSKLITRREEYRSKRAQSTGREGGEENLALSFMIVAFGKEDAFSQDSSKITSHGIRFRVGIGFRDEDMRKGGRVAEKESIVSEEACCSPSVVVVAPRKNNVPP